MLTLHGRNGIFNAIEIHKIVRQSISTCITFVECVCVCVCVSSFWRKQLAKRAEHTENVCQQEEHAQHF